MTSLGSWSSAIELRPHGPHQALEDSRTNCILSVFVLRVKLFSARTALLDEHGIAEGEETVFFLHRGPVGPQRFLPSHQRADEHEQSALGQVEIGDERVNGLDPDARIDEDRGVPGAGMYDAVLRCHGFERPDGSGADADNPAAGRTDAVQGFGGLLRDLAELAVHDVLFGVLLLDGAKGAEPDVQEDRYDRDAFGADPLQQFRCPLR